MSKICERMCAFFPLDLSTNSDNLTPNEVIVRKNKLLKRVLYKIPDGMEFKERTSINKSDMLTVVVEISVCDHIKVIILHYRYTYEVHLISIYILSIYRQ